jgi:hypothetical protein
MHCRSNYKLETITFNPLSPSLPPSTIYKHHVHTTFNFALTTTDTTYFTTTFTTNPHSPPDTPPNIPHPTTAFTTTWATKYINTVTATWTTSITTLTARENIGLSPGLWIRIDLMRMRIRIQHFLKLRIRIQY